MSRPTAAAVVCLALLAAVAGRPVPADALEGAKPPAPALDPASPPVPQWVWGQAAPADNQEVYFRRAFDLPLAAGQKPMSAVLWASCDNEMEVFVNGTRFALSQTWETPTTADVAKALVAGRNVVSVRGKNHDGVAGLAVKLRVELPGGKTVDVATDGSWKTSPDVVQKWWDRDYDDADWKPAKVVAAYGAEPWGKLPKQSPAVAAEPGRATPAEALTLLPGFKAELVYSVPRETQGSWVSMCPDGKGRLIVCDQAGPLYRVTPGKGQADTKVEKIDLPIGHAQGMLWADGGLYVMVNGPGIGGNGAGLYRLTYDAATDAFTDVKRLAAFKTRSGTGPAGGEHGPHAVRLGPDGKLYVTAGNFTRIPDNCSPNSPARNWAEDLLLPRNPDGGGHDPTTWAPGGWVARCDKDGTNWELLCVGLRNAYDFDFNADGDFFVYDSDMEWDTGTPWYRPTRLVLGVPGGEYGWRNGTGKWPDYYPDSMPTVANMGLGSPTGVAFGRGAKFPAKYQRALYCMDWAYGKLYAAHLTPDGAGYKATFEPFVEGKGWDGTDVVIGGDGAMYVTIGGRGTQSGLYRITYAGTEATEPALQPVAATSQSSDASEGRPYRRWFELMTRFAGGASLSTVDLFVGLGDRDRYIRYAARRALETRPFASWRAAALSETKPTAAINALIALTRAVTAEQAGRPDEADKTNVPLFQQPTRGIDQTIGTAKVPANAFQADLQKEIFDALTRIPLTSLSEEQRLELLRAYQLCFIRLGKPSADQSKAVAERFDPLFPSASPAVSREAAVMLAYVEAPTFVPKAVAQLAKATTQEDQLHYAMCLRFVKAGWTLEARKTYFAWLDNAQRQLRGGNSFPRFVAGFRADALSTLPEAEQAAMAEFLKTLKDARPAQAVPPRQFVRNWQMADLVPALEGASNGRNFARGKAAFEAVQCARCHRFGTEGGGGIGPDLTGVGNRFQPLDLLEATLLPSKVISDQYQATEVRTKDGDVIVGHVAGEDAATLTVATDPFNPGVQAKVKKSDVSSRRPGKLSLMPEGLVDTLTKDEILDLIAYMRSGGDARDSAFK